MTPELPANEMNSVDGVDGMDDADSNSARKTSAPAAMRAPKRTQPLSSSGKHPLPGPWPQQVAPQPFPEAEDLTAAPSVTSEQWLAKAEDQTAVPAVTKERRPAEAIDLPTTPIVTSERWLAEPKYWLADHQRVPRPPTRPIARPQRFRRISRTRSALLATGILILAVAIGAGMVLAGQASYEFFNRSAPVPTVHPASATPTLPANAAPTQKP